MTLDTQRLQLLPYSGEQILALIEQPERYEALTGAPPADGLREMFRSGEVSPAWLAALRATPEADPWRYGFAMVHRERGIVIGSAGFKGPPDEAGMVEIAYGIVPDFEGQGFATEAAAALIAFATKESRVRLIRAHTLPEPNASTHVLTKCGFLHTASITDPEDGPVWRWERPASPTEAPSHS